MDVLLDLQTKRRACRPTHDQKVAAGTEDERKRGRKEVGREPGVTAQYSTVL